MRTTKRAPSKYFKGLSKQASRKRAKEIEKFGALSWKDPAAYVGFKTNKGVKTKKSGYTESWNRLFPNAKSLKDKSKASGVPERFLKECYNRGMAAWRTGHRPGATEQQWAYARVHSLLMCGKTYYSTDSDIVKRASDASASAKKWWSKSVCQK